MPPATGTALLILVAFVLPGFATVLFKERMHEAWREVTPLERVLQTGYYSVLSYLLLALFALVVGLTREDVENLYRDHNDTPADLMWRAALAILAPALIVANASRVWEGSKLRDKSYLKVGINARHRVPTAWDHLFSRRQPALMLVTLRDGRVVGGYYGHKSFAAYDRDGRDLYLEHRWALNENNWFEQRANDTMGLWLPTAEVVSIELYEVDSDDEEPARALTTFGLLALLAVVIGRLLNRPPLRPRTGVSSSDDHG
jgi:4-amino-4-deoxy-L-arabinose transferase-like glycosyltransferase